MMKGSFHSYHHGAHFSISELRTCLPCSCPRGVGKEPLLNALIYCHNRCPETKEDCTPLTEGDWQLSVWGSPRSFSRWVKNKDSIHPDLSALESCDLHALPIKSWTSWVWEWKLDIASNLGPQDKLLPLFLPWLPDSTHSGEIPQPSKMQPVTAGSPPSWELPSTSPLCSGSRSSSSMDTFLITLYQKEYSVLFLHVEQTEASRAWVIYPKVTWVQ